MSSLDFYNNDIHVKSWDELQNILFKDSWDKNIERFRSPFVYRGLSDKNYDLRTTLTRLGGMYDTLEGHLLRNFRKYAHQGFTSSSSVWNWMAIAQHHGLPTRLLDWTYSPYIALHFATTNILKYNVDGVIWSVNYVTSRANLPTKLRDVLSNEGSNVFSPEMLDMVCRSLKEFDSLQENPFVLFLEPPSLDDRIVNQHALFSMMSGAKEVLDEWLVNQQDKFFRIIIPAELKWEIRDKLDQANITERVLFPGLDGLSLWLKRHYSPKV